MEADVATIVDEGWLERVCCKKPEELTTEAAYDVAVSMGRLAPWWLRGEVLEKARRRRAQLFTGGTTASNAWQLPAVPRACGCCWVLLAFREPERFGLLKPAAVLPLRWERNASHHPHLPGTLRRVADEVVEVLRGEEKEIAAGEGWALVPEPADLLCEHDLSSLSWPCESAWVSLVGGLLLAAWKEKPNPEIWASGEFVAGKGIMPVDGIAEKAAAAAEFGAKKLFLPKENITENIIRATADEHGLTLVPLGGATEGLRKGLGNYLDELEVPPGREASQEQRRNYFLRVSDDSRAQKYYRQYILPDVLNQSAAARIRQLQTSHLVMIISGGYSQVDIALAIAQPRRCLLLYNEDKAREAEAILQRVHSDAEVSQVSCQSQQFHETEYDGLVREFRGLIQAFLGSQPPERLVVDVTGGQRVMNLALYDAAPEGSQVMCCQAKWSGDVRRPEPFTERFQTWQKDRKCPIP